MNARASWSGRSRTRAAGSIVDQIVSSAGNFLVPFAALHHLGLAGVAACTLAYTAVTLVLGVARPLILTPLVVRFSAAGDRARRRATRMAAGASLLLGLLVLEVCAGISLLLPEAAGDVVLAAGFALVPILVQDALRYHCFASGRPWSAAVNDAVCLFAIGVATTVVVVADAVSVASLLLAWGAGVAVGAVAGCVQLRVWPRPFAGLRWIREQRDIGLPLAAGGVVTQGAGRAVPIVIGSIAGMAALGLLAAGQTLLLPINTVLAATGAFVLPECARRLSSRGARHVARILTAVSGALFVATLAYAAIVSVLPEALGRAYAGHNWDEALSMLAPVAWWSAATALCCGSWIGLQVYGASRTVLRVSIAQGALQLLGAGLGASLAGIDGGAWGIAIGSLLAAAVWATAFRRATARRILEEIGSSAHPTGIPRPRAEQAAIDVGA
ncbi:MAG: oligosaccharide flippase family protein [Sporichthyaceae bacterium]